MRALSAERTLPSRRYWSPLADLKNQRSQSPLLRQTGAVRRIHGVKMQPHRFATLPLTWCSRAFGSVLASSHHEVLQMPDKSVQNLGKCIARIKDALTRLHRDSASRCALPCENSAKEGTSSARSVADEKLPLTCDSFCDFRPKKVRLPNTGCDEQAFKRRYSPLENSVSSESAAPPRTLSEIL